MQPFQKRNEIRYIANRAIPNLKHWKWKVDATNSGHKTSPRTLRTLHALNPSQQTRRQKEAETKQMVSSNDRPRTTQIDFKNYQQNHQKSHCNVRSQNWKNISFQFDVIGLKGVYVKSLPTERTPISADRHIRRRSDYSGCCGRGALILPIGGGR